jgi:hypothetical protein
LEKHQIRDLGAHGLGVFVGEMGLTRGQIPLLDTGPGFECSECFGGKVALF